mgnify:FL=1
MALKSKLILFILYLVGLFGMMSPYRSLFLSLTPVNLAISAVILLLNHKSFTSAFLVFIAFVCLGGIGIEIIGTKTGLIFGQYYYGNTLGPKLFGVPVVIGINWLILIYCMGVFIGKLKGNNITKSVAGALLLVLLDIMIEPVAIHSDYWKWDNSVVPMHNYIGWFAVSLVFLFIFNKMQFNKTNTVAPVLLSLQFLFFGLLNYFTL